MPPRNSRRRPPPSIQSTNVVIEELMADLRDLPQQISRPLLYVTNCLKEPKNPTSCSGPLFMALLRHVQLKSRLPARELNTKAQGFYSILYAFITAERTDEECAAVIKKLETCSCSIRDWDSRNHHDEYRKTRSRDVDANGSKIHYIPRGRSMTWRLMHYMYQVVAIAMRGANSVKVTKGISKRWPSNLLVLLPSGPDVLLKSFFQWHHSLGNCLAPELLPATIRLSGPLLYESITNSGALSSLILDPIKSELDGVLAALETNPKVDGKVDDRIECSFVLLVNGLCDTLHEVFRQPIRANLRMLHSGAETKALQLCSVILYLLPHLEPHLNNLKPAEVDLYKNFMAHYTAEIFEMFNMHLPSFLDIPVHPMVNSFAHRLYFMRVGAQSLLTHLELSARYIGNAIRLFRNSKSCSGPGCQRSFSNIGSSFKRCAGCSIAGYCGRDCQLLHWNLGDERASHKLACKIMRKIQKEYQEYQNAGNVDLDGMDDTDPDILETVIMKMWENVKLDNKELQFMVLWAQRTTFELNDRVDVQEAKWHPGYNDYEEILGRLVKLGSPEPAFVDRHIFEAIFDRAMGRLKTVVTVEEQADGNILSRLELITLDSPPEEIGYANSEQIIHFML